MNFSNKKVKILSFYARGRLDGAKRLEGRRVWSSIMLFRTYFLTSVKAQTLTIIAVILDGKL